MLRMLHKSSGRNNFGVVKGDDQKKPSESHQSLPDTTNRMMATLMMHESSGRTNFGVAKEDDKKDSTKSPASSKLTAEVEKQIGEQTNVAIAAAQASAKEDNKSNAKK